MEFNLFTRSSFDYLLNSFKNLLKKENNKWKKKRKKRKGNEPCFLYTDSFQVYTDSFCIYLLVHFKCWLASMFLFFIFVCSQASIKLKIHLLTTSLRICGLLHYNLSFGCSPTWYVSRSLLSLFTLSL